MVFLLPWIEEDLHVSSNALDAFYSWFRYGADFAVLVIPDLRIAFHGG